MISPSPPSPHPNPLTHMASGLLGPVNVLFIPLKPGSSFPMIIGVGDVARGRRSSCAAALPCGPAIQVKRATPCNTGLRRPVCWQDTESNSNAATSPGEECGIEYARESCRAQRDRPAPGLQSVSVLPHRLSAAPVAMEVPIITAGPASGLRIKAIKSLPRANRIVRPEGAVFPVPAQLYADPTVAGGCNL